jgi:exopolysaccharide production protein ExoQ
MRAGDASYPPLGTLRAREAPALSFVDRLYGLCAGVIAFLMLVQIGGAAGTLLVAIEIGLALVMFAIAPAETARVAVRCWPLLIVPLLACASVLWSGDAMVSLRYGAQFVLTAFIGVFVASRVSSERLVVILFWAGLIFLLASIASGRQGVSTQGYVLIGLSGSKNQIGNAAQFQLLLAATLLIMPRLAPLHRLAALVSLPLAAWLLYQSNAATPLVLAAAGFALFGTGVVMLRAAPVGRLVVLAAMLCLAAPLFFLAPEIDLWLQDFMANVLGKDPTLTGRTLLWAKAEELIALRPWLGHGYQALWVGQSPEAVGLRLWTGMEDGRTFNFHNSFLQYAADLGYVGASAFALTLAIAIFAWIGAFLRGIDVARTAFLALFVTLLARLPTEVILGAFSYTTLLFFIGLRLAFDRSVGPSGDA